ncbi:MAG: DNA-directed DNA polymerase II small subunit [Promethearchaeota archaeon]
MENKTLNIDNFENKKNILRKLINSGINITPQLLDYILMLDNPMDIINQIIKETSFIPSFKSHLTENFLKKIPNNEIKKSLERILFKKEGYLIEDESNIKNIVNQNQSVSLNDIKKKTTTSLEKDKKTQERNFEFTRKTSLFEDHENKYFEKNSKNKERVKLIESAKSSFNFKPIAKEYSAQIKILKDPTRKIHTNGEYEDFYDLTLDKFNRLKKLMRRKTEARSADNINNILRLSSKVTVSLIGIVNEIRKTKNNNFILVLEDLTGLVNVIIRKDSENQENIKIAERTLNDQVVYIEGTYNPGEKGKKGIIYCNYISKIDIPKDYTPNTSPDPLSIVLVSDTHIGSKEFEEKLWNRFISFLKGKIGNKYQREKSGRIKYIIINGDLVDGIGVYPNQISDLVISDIYDQFEKAKEILSEIPDHIKIIYSPGNHEPVRNALPRPAVPKKYSESLLNIDVICIGNPSVVQTHNVNTIVYHGDSILDLNQLIPGLDNNKPIDTMKELLKCRHLAPVYGGKTQIAPTKKDWLVIDKIPDIFHTGHIHINGIGFYNNIALVNSGCFQSQTEFMNSLGIHPTPGILSIIELDTLKGTQLDLKISI